MKPSPVFVEITAGTLRALRDREGLDLPLERGADGRLTQTCREQLVAALQKLADRKPWQSRATACCALPANGVSLRRLSLPASAGNDLQQLLRLQIEAEFPLSPDELAWGWQALESGSDASRREVLVAAVKKEVVEDYAAVLAASGLTPVFTLAGVARQAACPAQLHPFAMLELGRKQSELSLCNPGVTSAVRVLTANADTSLAEVVGRALGPNWNGRKIFIANGTDELAAQLQRQLGNDVACETLKLATGAGHSSAIIGLKRLVEQNHGVPPLAIQVKTRANGRAFQLSEPEVRQWAVRAAVLLVVLLLLPFAEALLLKPFLARKLSRLKAEKVRLAMIDRELEFLQSLKQSQPPYLDALYTFARCAPPGTKLDSLNMNRRGEVSLRTSMRSGDQVTDFRSKLLNSGFFSSVAVEEQSPTPDRQKVNLRISAQWKAYEARVGWTNGPTLAEIERAKTNSPAGGGGGFSPGMMPMGMPGMPEGIPSPRSRR
ncbi:MAG: pilus assembly protein PilM [Verrucomicrobiota bacterium]